MHDAGAVEEERKRGVDECIAEIAGFVNFGLQFCCSGRRGKVREYTWDA